MKAIPFRLEPKILFSQPVTSGVPFPKGRVDLSQLKNWGPQIDKKIPPYQWEPLLFWPDGSVKWALLSFLAPKGAEKGEIKKFSNLTSGFRDIFQHIQSATFEEVLVPNFKIKLAKNTLSGDINGFLKYKWKVIHPKKKRIKTTIDKININEGSFKCEILRKGSFSVAKKKKLIFWERITLYCNKLIKIEFTIRNPHRAIHKGGYWDLGDPGSIYIKGLDFLFSFTKSIDKVTIKPSPDKEIFKVKDNFNLYQESSGEKNWRSRNHINRLGYNPLTFRGYRLEIDSKEISGNKANPILEIFSSLSKFSLAFPKFWQNFPKTLAYNLEGSYGKVGLFPEEFPDLHEIQGGEQKTHTFWLYIGEKQETLEWCFNPSLLILNPDYIAQTKTILYFTSQKNENIFYQKVLDEALNGPHSFFKKRKIIDEYGWRNFGDIYADHENIYNQGEALISHYNNQYDLIYSFLVNFLKTGIYDWFTLANDLAKHVYDIDIYHTEEDKQAYNNGLFWHTYHYVDAFRSTHRCYSKDANITGGGPSNEHLYSSGLLLFYLLTGDPWAHEAVINFAEHVIEMDKPYKILKWLDRSPSGLASQTRDPWYHGPGRGGGNAINSLLDAYIITEKKKYLNKAEELICRCIHPQDNIENLGLRQPEERWSYTIFLQILGKYLLLKAEKGSFDYNFAYARSSLLHYARWMVKNEYIYLDKPELLEYPTETWAAQELRKAEVLNLAAYFSSSDKERRIFEEKAKYFYEEALKRLFTFKTWYYTRPLAVVLQNGFSWPWFKENKPPLWRESKYNFGKPKNFIPQKIQAKQKILRLFKIPAYKQVRQILRKFLALTDQSSSARE